MNKQEMKFKEGDVVIIGGYSDGTEGKIMKVLKNTNRYRVKTTWSGSSGRIVEERDVYKSLKEYHEHYIEFAKEQINWAKNKFDKTKEYFKKNISESEEFLKSEVFK